MQSFSWQDEFRSGRGVVPRNVPEYQVILKDGSLYIAARRRSLFVTARAKLILRSHDGAEMWLMLHTPHSDPGAFNSVQNELFVHSQCSRIVKPRASLRDLARYCREPSAPRVEFGYCAGHNTELLTPCQYPPHIHARSCRRYSKRGCPYR